MPIDREDLEGWIAESGHYLHHVSSSTALPSIVEHGLDAARQEERPDHAGFFRPRAGRVYLATPAYSPVIEVYGRRALLAVDIGALDTKLIDPDEDQVQNSFLQGGAGWLAVPPPRRQLHEGHELPGQDGALAAWANTTPGFDSPAITRRSLAGGSVSYRGRIPSGALQEVHPSSVALGEFHARAADLPGLSVYPPVPALEVWTVEVERAMRLARSLTGCVLDLLGAARPDHISRPEHFLAVSRRLASQSRQARHNLTDAVGLSTVEFLVAATDLADKASELTQIGWAADADTCRSIGDLAAQVVTATAARFGNEEAARVANFSLVEATLAMVPAIARP